MTAGWAGAESLSIKAVMSPKQQIQCTFPTPDKHILLMVQREGTVSGAALFERDRGTEYGVHDIVPGVGGNPRGYYLITLQNGDQPMLQWSVQATFIAGSDGSVRLLDNGVWQFIGRTGGLQGIQGAGTMHIKAVSPTDREFSFAGEYVFKK